MIETALSAKGQLITYVICMLLFWYALYHWRNRKNRKV